MATVETVIQQPDFVTFRRGYSGGQSQVVYSCFPSDLETPVSLFLKLTNGKPDSFLLESVTGGEIRGRYSVIGYNPDLIWESRGSSSWTYVPGGERSAETINSGNDPIASLRSLLKASEISLPGDLPPMAAGLFGYLGYDMIRLVEHLPDTNPDPLGLPDAMMIRPSVIVVVDGVRNEITIVSPAWVKDRVSPERAFDEATARIKAAIEAIGDPLPVVLPSANVTGDEPVPQSNMKRDAYRRIVERAKAYIRAGDIFQVVLSHRWAMKFTHPPLAFYRALRRTNPSPYMFYFNFGGFQVCGASPETLVSLRGGIVTVRPIAGTRKRGKTAQEDTELEAELLGDPKEMAEHLMLLDLGRNDVGRVAKIGTVEPTETFAVERYSHVMHIVSNVIGQLGENQDALSALLAGMPAGTVAGAPKVRAMEIIDELETEKRGVYAGGIGYFSSGGDMDLCIALRTAVLKDQTLYVQAGGGVVHDSDPDSEYQETVDKSGALVQAARDSGIFVDFRNRG